MDGFEQHTLKADHRHWKKGDVVLLRPHVAERLHEDGVIDRDKPVRSEKPAKGKK